MPARTQTCWGDFAHHARLRLNRIAPPLGDRDKLAAYVNDPVGFSRDVLGVDPSPDQREILTAMRDNHRLSVSAGRKVGKSHVFAIGGLWFYCTRPGARVIVMNPVHDQIKRIIWREVQKLVRHALISIPGAATIAREPRTGLRDPVDFSEFVGYTAREPEAIAGVSGAHIMYLLDEASAIDEPIITAILGNLAGGDAWLCMISNPTRAVGFFYESHHSQAERFRTFMLSSETSPNVTGDWQSMQRYDRELGAWVPWDRPIPGLATAGWIDEMREQWGEQSADYIIHVRGEFAAAEELKIFTAGMLLEAKARWEATAAEGRLYIGVDPAGTTGDGDESAFVVRRGDKVLSVTLRRGLTAEGHVVQIEGLLKENRRELDAKALPAIIYDAEGMVGAQLRNALNAHPGCQHEWLPRAIRTSKPAERQPHIFHSMREELWMNAYHWMLAGGAIPEHHKLEHDLRVPEKSRTIRGLDKLMHKDEMRKLLGRSPDAGDAFVLACWEPRSLADVPGMPQRVEGAQDPFEGAWVGGSDPFDAHRTFDPFGGR